MTDAPGRRGGKRRGRLSRSADFDRVYRDGRSHANRFLIVYSFPRASSDRPRLGLSVGRKVGGAVARNGVKRALREAFSACAEALPDGHDFVIVARPELAALTSDEGKEGVERELRSVLDAAGLTAGESA